MCSEYSTLCSTAIVTFDGQEIDLDSLMPYFGSTDREVRKNSIETFWNFYADNSEKIDSIFDKLVKIRNSMSVKLGYSNYVGLSYSMHHRTDYGPDTVKSFGNNILKYFLPLTSKLKEKKESVSD